MLPQQNRIRRGDEYRRTVKTGKRVNGAHCLLHVVHTAEEHPARFGFIVSKAVGKATVRNTVRRRYKAIGYELIHEGLRGYDIVLRVNPSSAVAPFQELRSDVRSSLRRVIPALQPEASRA